MKKTTQRLALETQTIRVLSTTELRAPRGGLSDPGEPPPGDPGLPVSHDHCTAAPPSHP